MNTCLTVAVKIKKYMTMKRQQGILGLEIPVRLKRVKQSL